MSLSPGGAKERLGAAQSDDYLKLSQTEARPLRAIKAASAAPVETSGQLLTHQSPAPMY